MSCRLWTLVLAGALAGPAIAGAQITTTRLSTATTTLTNDQLTARLIALEARVAQLESLLSLVNGQLVLDGKGAPVLVKGSTISLWPDRTLTLRAGFDLRLDASGPISFKSGRTASIEAAGQLDLRGSRVVLNGGTKPAACLGALTNSVAARLDHLHQLTGEGCGATVLVP